MIRVTGVFRVHTKPSTHVWAGRVGNGLENILKQGRRGTSSLQAIVTLEQRLTTNPNEAIRSSWVVERSSHIAATGQTLNRSDSASQVE